MSVVPSGSNTLTVEQDLDYTPYGIVAYGTPTDRHQFTGTEYDSESSLNYFGARHYGSLLGRFMVPDPAGLAAQSPSNPQGWNLYAYVLNNPLKAIDPTGLYCAYLNDAGTELESIDDVPTGGGNVSPQGAMVDPQVSPQNDCRSNGGYWIEGNFGAGSTIAVNSDAGTVTGVGYDSSGNAELSTAGAMGSNAWGAWTQTFSASTTASYLTPVAANNGTWQTIKNIARKIGNYIPTLCGGGVYNYSGLQVSNGVSSVAVSQMQVADSRAGYLQGPFGEFGYGEGIVGGVGQATFNTGNETFLFGGVGGDAIVGGGSLSAFGTSTGSFGYNLEGEIGPFKGGVGIYQNVTSITSCLDNGGR
jgi:RHS repeat-associated protein